MLWLNLFWQWVQYYCRFVAVVDPFSTKMEGSLHPSSEYNREINTREIISVISFFLHKSKSLEHIFAQNLSPSCMNVYQKTLFLATFNVYESIQHTVVQISLRYFLANAGIFLLLPIRICTCASNDLHCGLQLFFSIVIGSETQQNMIDMNEPSYSMC